MGTYTLANLRTELLFDLKNRSDTSTPDGLTTTRQTSFINAGYLHVCDPSVYRHRELRYSYTIALASGTMAYTFSPSGSVVIVGDPFSISHVSAATDDFSAFRTKLFPRDEQWFQERSHVNGGEPRDYFTRGNQIFLSPIPGANETGEVLSVTAWREPAVLSADGDVTVLSTKWDEIILLAARWRAELHLGYRQLAEATKVDFTSLINEYADHERRGGEDWGWQTEVRNESYMERA